MGENPDTAENKAEQAAIAIGEHTRELWLAAHAEGVRSGLEGAATMADECAKKIADDYSMDAAIRIVSVRCLNEMRDYIRLTALRYPDLELPKGDAR
ncbi:Uncharacterised protein [Mycobacteroides abscessus subsp. bolletii]|uniref:hypothetical protein n=1 Tax=Mycobacteroides abscessus TaxID=36809 RepID=UPI0009A684AE|nr:hypothetical protein [Mycobacteroides abscessus]SKV05647.1 Uncharacterised protein [Mycobacteroides abscessus subsp. bolletii]